MVYFILDYADHSFFEVT